MKNTVKTGLMLGVIFAMASCSSLEEKKKAAEEEGNAIVSLKSKLVKGAGDALKSDGKEAAESASEGVSEVIKGLTSGYDKSINQAKVLADSIFLESFEIGRTEKNYSDTSATKSVSLYLISKSGYDGKILLKAFDTADKEIGRSTLTIKLDEDDASYFDLVFDARTPLLLADYFVISKK